MPLDPHAVLERLGPTRMRFGLSRVRDALDALDRPERRFAAIHVAGTNGKGSTCAFLAAALRTAGRRVGLFTSPHLHRFNERIAVDGRPIDDAELAAGIEAVAEALPGGLDGADGLTYFELATVVAFRHFARAGVEWAVIETGLGGRLDATNVLVPAACAVTRVALDHTEILGSTVEAVAAEKAGIFKPGVPAVVGPQSPAALAVLACAAAGAGAPLWIAGRDFVAERAPDIPGEPRSNESGRPVEAELVRPRGGSALRFAGRSLRIDAAPLALAGPHQIENAGVACAVLDALAPRLSIAAEAVGVGLAAAEWPGRFERRGRFVFDGAHNPDAARALRAALDELVPGSRCFVFGVLADKDHAGMARALFPGASAVHLVRPRSARARDPEVVVAAVREIGVPATIHAAVPDALAAAAASGEVVVVCGSLVLVAEAREGLDATGRLVA